MLECTEKCIFQIDGVCRKSNCTGASFASSICPYFVSVFEKLENVEDAVKRYKADI